MGGAVLVHAYAGQGPGKRLFVGVSQIKILSTGHQLLPNGGHGAFHFTLVFRRTHLRRIGNKTIMPFEFGVGAVDGWIIQIGLDHTGLEIIQQHGLWTAVKEFEGPDMTVQPSVGVLAFHEPNIAVAAVGQHHDKGPDLLPDFAQKQRYLAEVHLGLIAGVRFQPHRYRTGWIWPDLSDIALDACVTEDITLFCKKTFDLLGGHVRLIKPRLDRLLVAGDALTYHTGPRRHGHCRFLDLLQGTGQVG